MSQATPESKFPDTIWDGLTSTSDDVSIEKNPDIAMGNRMRAEIRGIETTIQPYMTDLAIINAYGTPNYVLTVNVAGTGVEWAASAGGGGGGSTVDLTNDNAGSLVIGNAVYVKTDGDMDKAQANTAATTELLGLATETIVTTADGEVQADGFLTATTGEWDAVTGDTGGLTAGSIYYLDPSTAGRITETAPSTVGQYVVRVGQAISTTIMNIRTEAPILL